MGEALKGKECKINIDGVAPDEVAYHSMTLKDKENVQYVTHLCDSAFTSDAAYHELSIYFPDMPRKSNISACRNDINAMFTVHRTPGMIPGSYISLRSELEKDIKSIEKKEDMIIRIKESGDGAKVSRVSNFIAVSYSVIELESSNSHFNHKVLAVVNCVENHENLKKIVISPLERNQ